MKRAKTKWSYLTAIPLSLLVAINSAYLVYICFSDFLTCATLWHMHRNNKNQKQNIQTKSKIAHPASSGCEMYDIPEMVYKSLMQWPKGAPTDQTRNQETMRSKTITTLATLTTRVLVCRFTSAICGLT